MIRVPFEFSRVPFEFSIGETGSVGLDQIVDPQTYGTANNGPAMHIQTWDRGNGLDTEAFLHNLLGKPEIWSAGAAPSVGSDLPAVLLSKGANMKVDSVREDFTTTLLFKPASGTWVPLAAFTWYWGGTATNNGGWKLTNGYQDVGAPQLWPAFPSWTITYTADHPWVAEGS